ncbi:MAG: DNA repair protein RecN [Acetobacter sp.]|nr:DNA repair protein RecN [Bacteroides sp.]MCM1340583.1 DNA repair protein RecN [Acetobacter sp.]MCM1433323.1 DNA repair protein RecN [Clostridiales bacterium]
MLKGLDIENIAVIEKTTVDFSRGLNVLTGETGAGKSIVVDSINAILGERTSKELVRHGADNAYVSAYFEDISDNVIYKLKELDFNTEDDKSLLLTRRISSNGKSVCRINGKAATVSMLKEIGSLLVNIHGQHDSQALLNPDYQYQYVDMLINNNDIKTEYKNSFKELIAVRRKLKKLTADESDKEHRLELLEFQINELEEADIKAGERDELIKRRNLIQKSEAISNALNIALNSINGDDEAVGAQTLINSAANSIYSFDEIKDIYSIYSDINDKIEEAKDKIELTLANINFDVNELEVVEERLDLLYRFSNKYGTSEQEMLDYLENAKKERDSIIYCDEEFEKLNLQYDEMLEKTVLLADKLSEIRKETAKEFEKKVKAELEYLDMPKLQFVVSFDKGKLTSNGYDVIEFLISTNPGEPPKPLAKIASGGELSRIMLAIKNILAYNDTISTLIFDEIDTGVSGRASQKIGLKLKSVSDSTQVICVTHSAQIASNADSHFLIKKEYNKNQTFTKVKPLDFEERKLELARIMGGLEVTDALLKSAEELLNN